MQIAMAIMLMTMVVLPAAAIAATAAVPWVTSSRLLKEDANPASRLLMPLGRPMASSSPSICGFFRAGRKSTVSTVPFLTM